MNDKPLTCPALGNAPIIADENVSSLTPIIGLTVTPEAAERIAEWQKHTLPVVIPIGLERAKRAAKESARIDRAVMDRAKHLTNKEGNETT
jgi:hypothetical protein